MKGAATPLVGSGDPAGGSDWVVESTTSLLRREPWIEVFEEHIRLPDGRLVDDFYTIRLRNFVVVAPLTANTPEVRMLTVPDWPARLTSVNVPLVATSVPVLTKVFDSVP